MESNFRILLVSDNPGFVQSMLNTYPESKSAPITLEIAGTLSDGLNRILYGGIEAILLHLPQAALFEALKSLREGAIRLPSIALIRVNEENGGASAIREGAHNYLFEKTMDMDSLIRSIQYAVETFKISEELRIANLKIMEYDRSVIEVERLKSLIDECASAAHELNQPLTALLGSVYLMRLEKGSQEKFSRHMERVEESGRRISQIVKNIQALCCEKNNFYLGSAALIHPEQKLKSNVETADESFRNLNNLFRTVQARCNRTAAQKS